MIQRWGWDRFRTGLARAVEDAARQALATSTTPGLAVALVHGGQVVWAAGYGNRMGSIRTVGPAST
jgi:CubicO group peptidase (beta-lactamase class C family)